MLKPIAYCQTNNTQISSVFVFVLPYNTLSVNVFPRLSYPTMRHKKAGD